ncbi:MAG: choice-of-anchor Q domain-containing protein [Solirubrobacteraceae bacterium]
MVLPVAAAALAFAPLASAQYAQPTVTYTPTSTAALEADVSAADGAAAGTLSIIQLQPNSVVGNDYLPTVPLMLQGDIEITGPPTYQNNVTVPFGGDANVNGQDEQTTPSPVDLFTVENGANVLFKAFDIQTGSPIGNASIRVNGGGVAEIDNMGLDGDATVVKIDPGNGSTIPDGLATITNSNLSDGDYDAVENNSSTAVAMVNDTMIRNEQGAIGSGPVDLVNSILVNNGLGKHECFQPATLVIDTIVDDSTCGTPSAGGVITETFKSLKVVTTNGVYNGGPSASILIGTGSTAIGKANTAYCSISDQRFFLRTPSTCDDGAYQTTGTQDASTAGPVCTPNAPVYSTNPATMTVDAQDSVNTIGLGPDSITNLQSVLKSNPAVANGAATWPIVNTTWFDETDPGAPAPYLSDSASTSAFPVTDAKPTNDNTVGDTSWSFMAQNWLGFTTLCQ